MHQKTQYFSQSDEQTARRTWQFESALNFKHFAQCLPRHAKSGLLTPEIGASQRREELYRRRGRGPFETQGVPETSQPERKPLDKRCRGQAEFCVHDHNPLHS